MSNTIAPINPFAHLDVPTFLSVQAEHRKNHPFLIWEPFEGEPRQWSYAEFDHTVRRLAVGLSARGVKPGDRVLIHMDNCVEIILAWYACAALGAVAVTTNARSAGKELAYFADHSQAVAGLTQPAFAELMSHHCSGLKWMAVTETDSDGSQPADRPDQGAESFERLYRDASDFVARAPDCSLPVGIQYTSGTTSRPKGVVWTHANALWGAKVCAVHENLTADDIHLCYLPLFHTNAQSYSVLAALWAGATVVVQPRFSASRFWPISLKHRCTWSSMVPFCARALMDRDVPKAHHYRFWGNGICEAPWDAHFGVRTIGWWGMTETITHGTVGNPFAPDRPLTMGRPAPEYDIAVVDDRDNPVAFGESGRLKIRGVRGLSLFAEYLNNREATEGSFDAQGYFDTGDRVILLDDGYLQFADRDKDMLKVGGENVAASEIERVISTVPGISEIAVVAKSDTMLDQVPVAFLLAHPENQAAADALKERVRKACAEELADFKQPRDIIILDAFPRSTLEKIAKNELRKMLEQ